MEEARRAGDWGAYQQELQEAREAKRALRNDQGQVEHEQQELGEQQPAYRDYRNEWSGD